MKKTAFFTLALLVFILLLIGEVCAQTRLVVKSARAGTSYYALAIGMAKAMTTVPGIRSLCRGKPGLGCQCQGSQNAKPFHLHRHLGSCCAGIKQNETF